MRSSRASDEPLASFARARHRPPRRRSSSPNTLLSPFRRESRGNPAPTRSNAPALVVRLLVSASLVGCTHELELHGGAIDLFTALVAEIVNDSHVHRGRVSLVGSYLDRIVRNGRPNQRRRYAAADTPAGRRETWGPLPTLMLVFSIERLRTVSSLEKTRLHDGVAKHGDKHVSIIRRREDALKAPSNSILEKATFPPHSFK